MKTNVKYFILGVLVTLSLISTTIYADSLYNTIEVVFNKINISINGKQVAKQGENYVLDNGEEVPFSILYDGTTYLPIRKVSDLLGKNVTWDGDTLTAGINDEGFIIEIEKEVNSNLREVTRKELCKFFVESLELEIPQNKIDIADVPETDEYYPYIATMINEEMWGLYPDSTFRPDYMIRRCEYAKLLVNALNYNTDKSYDNPGINDIEGHWAENYICAVLENDLMNTYDDNTFRPDEVYISDLTVDKSLKDIKEANAKIIQDYIANIEIVEINKPYKLNCGLELTINKLSIIEEKGYNKLTIKYTQENKSADKELSEGNFLLKYEDGTTDSQYGFFNNLFPYESKERETSFKYLKDKTPKYIEFRLLTDATEKIILQLD